MSRRIIHTNVGVELGSVEVYYTPAGEVVYIVLGEGGDFFAWSRRQGFEVELESGAEDDLPVRELKEYFSGRRRYFQSPLPMRGTPFQRRVWLEGLHIPFGETVSYGELSRRVFSSSPGSPRAVGQALAANPVPIIVPCHRVLAKDGGLGGFGGGLKWKRYLLDLEGAYYKED